MRQLMLPLKSPTTYTHQSYYTSRCNQDAYEWVKAYPTWKAMQHTTGLCIEGAEQCGKSHLCTIAHKLYPSSHFLNGKDDLSKLHPFDLAQPLIIIDNADKANEEWLFHLFNHARSTKRHLLLSMHSPYQQWCQLPDLHSRLSTMLHTILFPPDDEAMQNILQKQFTDIGIIVTDQLIQYLSTHIDRTYSAINFWVKHLNQKSIELKKPVSVNLARQLLSLT